MSKQQGAQFLGPQQREAAWEQLQTEQFDVVVVGGGVVGVGAALDAATRGLKVALVEARDYASGTSSRSSKMFHGGLRYLEQLEFGLVREALRERELADHARSAPGQAAEVSVPLGSPSVGTPVHGRGNLPLRPDGRRQIGPLPEALDPGGRTAHVAEPQAQFTDRWHPVLRHRRRRRSAHHDRCTDRRPLRRGCPNVDAGRGISA